MSNTASDPRLLLPFLEPFYRVALPFSWLVIRVAAGLDLAIHGWSKVAKLPVIFAALSHGTAASLAPQFDPFHNTVLAFFEFVGGIAIAFGLFTRFFAAAAAIELAIITFTVYWPKGYHAYEYTLLWGLVMFAIALRGGGPWALDRFLGREL
jgi:putative oxidoreductase